MKPFAVSFFLTKMEGFNRSMASYKILKKDNPDEPMFSVVFNGHTNTYTIRMIIDQKIGELVLPQEAFEGRPFTTRLEPFSFGGGEINEAKHSVCMSNYSRMYLALSMSLQMSPARERSN
jgi:hypothetical protein